MLTRCNSWARQQYADHLQRLQRPQLLLQAENFSCLTKAPASLGTMPWPPAQKAQPSSSAERYMLQLGMLLDVAAEADRQGHQPCLRGCWPGKEDRLHLQLYMCAEGRQ